jgi:hypothetical protein
MQLPRIQYYTRQQIDAVKWDACVNGSETGLIYANSFFLDAMADNWHALVAGDYEQVMPLCFRKKWGITYLYQPFLLPVGGVFGKDISQKTVPHFLKAIPKSYRLWDFSFQHHNHLPAAYKIQFSRVNMVLSLQQSYTQLQNQYSDNIHRNISKAQKAGCYAHIASPESIIDLCEKVYPSFTKIETGAFQRLREQYTLLQPYAKPYAVYAANHQLLSACIFLIKNNRAYYWLAVNHAAAKDAGSSALLINQFIKDYAGKPLVLDFEGSDNKGIAHFYKQFGAVNEPFTTLFHNKLPFPFRHLLKTPVYYTKLVSEQLESLRPAE